MQLTTPEGQVINAVYGFASMLLALTKELEPTHIVAALESEKEVVFREIEFPEYKATRIPKSPEEQAAYDSQFLLLLDFLKVARVKTLMAEGYEADDVIGTVARKIVVSGQKSVEVVVASNDRDLMQLIGGQVRFYLPAVGKRSAKTYGEKEFLEEYGFKPAQLVEYKALRGDPSDNIPGVRGIGDKTATELINKYGTLEKIYKSILDVKPSVGKKLIDEKDKAELSRKLATIVIDTPVEFKLEDLKFEGFDQPKVRGLFSEWGFKSLLAKINSSQEKSRSGENQLQLI
jgi:DNA polymerase-1